MSTTKRRRRINRDHIVPREPAAEQAATPVEQNKPTEKSSDKTEKTSMTTQKADDERSPLSAHRRLMRFEFPTSSEFTQQKQQKQRVRRVSRRSSRRVDGDEDDDDGGDVMPTLQNEEPSSSVASSVLKNKTDDTNASQMGETKESPPTIVVQQRRSRSRERRVETGEEREVEKEEDEEDEAIGVMNAHEEVKREYLALFGSDDDDSDDTLSEEQKEQSAQRQDTVTEEADSAAAVAAPSAEKKRRLRRRQQQQQQRADSSEVRRVSEAQSKMILLDSEREKTASGKRKERPTAEDEQKPKSKAAPPLLPPSQSPARTATEIPAIRIPKKSKTLEAKKEADAQTSQKRDRKDTDGGGGGVDRRHQEGDRTAHAASFPEEADDREHRESRHRQPARSPKSRNDDERWPLRDESDRERDRWERNIEVPGRHQQEDRYHRSSEEEIRATSREWRRGERGVHHYGHDDGSRNIRSRSREWPPHRRSLGEQQQHADPVYHDQRHQFEERRDRRDIREMRPFDDEEHRYRERESLDMVVNHDKRGFERSRLPPSDAPQDWRGENSRSPRRSDMHRDHYDHYDSWKRYGQHHREWSNAFDIVGERERPHFEERPFNDTGPYHHRREYEHEVYWGDPFGDRTSHHHAHRERFSPSYSPQEDHRRGLLGTPPPAKERDIPVSNIRKSSSRDTHRSRYSDVRGDRTRSPSPRRDLERWQNRRDFGDRRKRRSSPPATHRSKSRSRTRSHTRSPELHKRLRRSPPSRRSQGTSDRHISSEMMDTTNDDWHDDDDDDDSNHFESRARVEEEEKAPYSEPVDMSRIEMLHPTLHKLHELSFVANRNYRHFGMGTGFLPNFSDDVASLRVLEKDAIDDTKFNLPMPSVPQNATPSNVGTISPQHRPPIINISHLYKEKYGNISNPSSSTPPPMNLPFSKGDTDDRKAVKRQVGELVRQRLQKYYSQKRISSKEEFKNIVRTITHRIESKETLESLKQQQTQSKIMSYTDKFMSSLLKKRQREEKEGATITNEHELDVEMQLVES